MAERRMFAKTIIDSDAFLDMPLSAQALYFHLSMRADDEGFINNPKKIQRMMGASEDDLKLLIAKNFIIPFDSGIVVIKHWKIHNYIQNDRYKPTVYQDEKALLEVKGNKAYTLMDTECIQLGYNSDTQVRIGKDSIGKDNKRESITKDQLERVMYLYNTRCFSLPSIKSITDKRKATIKAMLKKYSLEDIEELFKLAEASAFLRGDNDRGWVANFDWIMKESNAVKIFEGNYDDKGFREHRAKEKQHSINEFPQKDMSDKIDQIEKMMLQRANRA